jgi:hypothetical protein
MLSKLIPEDMDLWHSLEQRLNFTQSLSNYFALGQRARDFEQSIGIGAPPRGHRRYQSSVDMCPLRLTLDTRSCRGWYSQLSDHRY